MIDRPKRRKYRDNPYILSYCEEKKLYIVTFKDVTGKINKIEVQEEVYKALDRFELDDIKEMNEYDRHIEHSEIYEDNLCTRAMDKPLLVDELVENQIINEELKKAIQALPKIQRDRLKKYYFEDMTLEEIAREEKCSKVAIKYSIDIAIEKISKKFKN